MKSDEDEEWGCESESSLAEEPEMEPEHHQACTLVGGKWMRIHGSNDRMNYRTE